jgi:hypothetical protein
MPKLSAASCGIRSMYHVSSIHNAHHIFAYFNFIIKDGKIVGGNSSNSKNVFTLKKH